MKYEFWEIHTMLRTLMQIYVKGSVEAVDTYHMIQKKITMRPLFRATICIIKFSCNSMKE